MKIQFAFFAVFFLFIRCSSDTDSPTVSNPKIGLDDPIEEINKVIYTDTIHQFYGISEYHTFTFNKASYDSLISINDKIYRLYVECELDSNQRVAFNDSYSDGGKLYSTTQIGYQGYYNFSLFDGDKQVFRRKLTKEDFKESVYSWVVASDAFLPKLVEYNSAFNAFIFACPFHIEGSCSSTEALLVLGLDGKVQLVDYLSSPSGNSTNWNVQFSPDHKALVSNSAIHFPNGKSINFDGKPTYILGTDVFDDCLLVVYDYNEKKHPKNAYLKDYKGKTLLNFKYTGWTGALGYSFLYKKVQSAYYFIEDDQRHLLQLKKENGKWKKTLLPFSNMEEFDGNEHPNDQMVDLSTEGKRFIFYFDASNAEIRKERQEE